MAGFLCHFESRLVLWPRIRPLSNCRGFMNAAVEPKRIGTELRLLLRRVRAVWQLIPRRHTLALGGAALIMALTIAGNTVLPLLLARLIDTIQAGTEARLA